MLQRFTKIIPNSVRSFPCYGWFTWKKNSFVQSLIVSVAILKPRVYTQLHATSSRITEKRFYGIDMCSNVRTVTIAYDII